MNLKGVVFFIIKSFRTARSSGKEGGFAIDAANWEFIFPVFFRISTSGMTVNVQEGGRFFAAQPEDRSNRVEVVISSRDIGCMALVMGFMLLISIAGFFLSLMASFSK